jgi:hypothetical protein
VDMAKDRLLYEFCQVRDAVLLALLLFLLPSLRYTTQYYILSIVKELFYTFHLAAFIAEAQ